MIRDRSLDRSTWEAKLRRWGCEPLEGKGKLNTAEWWRSAKGLFTVPIDDDGRCDFWAIQKICQQFGFPPDKNEMH